MLKFLHLPDLFDSLLSSNGCRDRSIALELEHVVPASSDDGIAMKGYVHPNAAPATSPFGGQHGVRPIA